MSSSRPARVSSFGAWRRASSSGGGVGGWVGGGQSRRRGLWRGVVSRHAWQRLGHSPLGREEDALLPAVVRLVCAAARARALRLAKKKVLIAVKENTLGCFPVSLQCST